MHAWEDLTREQTFVTDGTGSYAIATIVTDNDYDRPYNGTEWDRSNQKMVQFVTPQEWQDLKSGIVTNTGIYRFARVRGGNMLMTPDASGDTVAFEYVSNFYAKSSGGTRKATYSDDSDTSAYPEDLLKLGLKYYLKTEYGLPATEDSFRYYDTIDSLMAQDAPAKIIRPKRQTSRFIVNIPDSGAGQ